MVSVTGRLALSFSVVADVFATGGGVVGRGVAAVTSEVVAFAGGVSFVGGLAAGVSFAGGSAAGGFFTSESFIGEAGLVLREVTGGTRSRSTFLVVVASFRACFLGAGRSFEVVVAGRFVARGVFVAGVSGKELAVRFSGMDRCVVSELVEFLVSGTGMVLVGNDRALSIGGSCLAVLGLGFGVIRLSASVSHPGMFRGWGPVRPASCRATYAVSASSRSERVRLWARAIFLAVWYQRSASLVRPFFHAVSAWTMHWLNACRPAGGSGCVGGPASVVDANSNSSAIVREFTAIKIAEECGADPTKWTMVRHDRRIQSHRCYRQELPTAFR
ncbi:MAG TPA: hypothetical protein DCE43_10075 [Planctomycetaceae bacterium]|nr:hypothetical protein [Planctomycetaceae bacterium]